MNRFLLVASLLLSLAACETDMERQMREYGKVRVVSAHEHQTGFHRRWSVDLIFAKGGREYRITVYKDGDRIIKPGDVVSLQGNFLKFED